MGRHSELGVLVHLASTNLDLHTPALRAYDGGVDGSVEVPFGGGDVIIELPGNVGPQAVDYPKRGIAFGYRGDDDAHRPNVEHLLERELLPLHLAVDAVHVFRTPVHLGLDAGGAQLLLQVAAQSFDVAFAIRALLVQRGGEASILFRLEVSERQILELPF